jgi:hypothetical protein
MREAEQEVAHDGGEGRARVALFIFFIGGVAARLRFARTAGASLYVETAVSIEWSPAMKRARTAATCLRVSSSWALKRAESAKSDAFEITLESSR